MAGLRRCTRSGSLFRRRAGKVRRTGWRPGVAGHLMVRVAPDQVAEVESVYAVGQRLNLFEDRRKEGWVRVTELRRTGVCGGVVVYLLVFATCYPPAPPN
jgi:hypothetical protein